MGNVRAIVLGVFLCVVIPCGPVVMTALAGDLDSPGPPSSPLSAMYTVEAIYNRLNSGAAGSKRSGAFIEPSSGPTAGTDHTLDQVMGKAPAVDDTHGAGVAEVLSGKTFWGLKSGAWGPRTGTMATQTLSADSTTVEAGYYDATTLDAVDPNLAEGNIKNGVTIFGVEGERHGGCTCTGTLHGTRWCDNGDGTVTDLTTCLVWLKDASWGGQYAFWVDKSVGTDVRHRAAQLWDGSDDEGTANLSDGSVEGDWRLPTKTELSGLAIGTEAVSSGSMRAFVGVQSYWYWSSTSTIVWVDKYRINMAWAVRMLNGLVGLTSVANDTGYVWPVRSGN